MIRLVAWVETLARAAQRLGFEMLPHLLSTTQLDAEQQGKPDRAAGCRGLTRPSLALTRKR
jgi:hypothetical protein